MAKKVYECTFNSVNGENTGVWTRTGMARSYPTFGVLLKKNCPDNLHCYLDPSIGGTNNYYGLIKPEDYKINSNGQTVYVPLSKEYLTGWKLVDSPYETKTETKTQNVTVITTRTLSAYTTNKINAKELKSNSSSIDTTSSGNTDGIIKYNESGTSINESIQNYISYTSNSKRNNFFNNYSSFIADINTIENNLNIGLNPDNVSVIKNNMLTKFNRFLIAFPEQALPKTFAHVFFTRPQLNLYSHDNVLLPVVDNDPYFYYLNKNSPQLLKSLTKDFSFTHDFNPFLSNKAESFDLADEYIDTAEYGETFTGYKIKYGQHNIKSKTADSFSITYTDDNNYNIFKIHKAWTDYISRVYRGEFSPSRESITSHTLDYAASVYYILCGPDGETILFWTKYTGVFPSNTPSSASSWTKGNVAKVPEFSIKYEYSWKDDMNPVSLAEFNLNSARQSNYKYAKIYEPDLLSTGKTFVGAPFITTVFSDSNNSYEYKLRFRTAD